MNQQQDGIKLFDQAVRQFFRTALWIALRDPAWLPFACHAMRWQRRAARVRRGWEKRGLHVPPFAIASITHRCNLNCTGCYARARHRPTEPEMSAGKLRKVFAEAHELGISIILIAGGEPLTRPEILDITQDVPGITFPLFTNGLLIDKEMIAKLKRQRHVVPVLSTEGLEMHTDGRRGQGVYEHLQETMARLKGQGIRFGTSVTVTRHNFAEVTGRDYIRTLIAKGCRLLVFVNYVPVQEGTEILVLTEEQKATEATLMDRFQSEFPALFIAFPSGEDVLGGCLAAGRGLIHISPEGHVEPCPFAPVSDSSLQELSLREALQSELFRAIREGDGRLSETNGGCALWQNREWLASLVEPGQNTLAEIRPLESDEKREVMPAQV